MLGFKIEYTRENFAFISMQDAQLMIEKENTTWDIGAVNKPFGRGLNLQISVNNVEEILKVLKDKCCYIAFDLKVNTYKAGDEEFREKEFLVQDPDGYLLRFSQTL